MVNFDQVDSWICSDKVAQGGLSVSRWVGGSRGCWMALFDCQGFRGVYVLQHTKR